METSLFGLSTGSYMVNYGGTNTAYAAPSILAQTGGYTSAVFHGNTGSFWNRNNTYKQWGYNYFFDSSAFTEKTDENSFQYGLNDKYMFPDSIKYLEQMQQPFYVKYLTVSNHYPYTSLSGDEKEQGFPLAETKDETVNGYFATANYLDSAIKDFFDYLKETGLYDNSIIVMYGDHYGISDTRSGNLAELLGKNPETWSNYDKAMLQRVPYMIHIPGYTGGISTPLVGEVDALPTLLHCPWQATPALISRWDKTSYLLIISKPSHLEPQDNMLHFNTPATLVDFITLKQGKKLPTLMRQLKKITKPFVRQ